MSTSNKPGIGRSALMKLRRRGVYLAKDIGHYSPIGDRPFDSRTTEFKTFLEVIFEYMQDDMILCTFLAGDELEKDPEIILDEIVIAFRKRGFHCHSGDDSDLGYYTPGKAVLQTVLELVLAPKPEDCPIGSRIPTGDYVTSLLVAYRDLYFEVRCYRE